MRPLPFDLEDLRAFSAVIETGSFARAARRVGLSKSVLSRRVTGLEGALRAQLLIRGQRGVTVTEAGAAFQQTAADVLARLDQARDDAEAGASRLAGPIRIAGPLTFGVTRLAPALATFATRHPEVILDARLDDRMVDLQAGGFDLAIRIGRAPDASLSPRLLAPVRPYLLGSPDYLDRRGRPAMPADLAGHDVLVYVNADLDAWRAAFPEADTRRLNVRFRSDSGDALREAAIAGIGLVILPDFLVSAAVSTGRLDVLLAGHPLASAAIYAVSPPGRPVLRRVRALVEHFATELALSPS